MTQPSTLKPTIDLDADGMQCGFLKLPHSVTRSAYGWVPIPMVSIRNGQGPRVLLVAGNHGDEYEGQAALIDLVLSISPEQVRGQIIVLSAVNFPAVMGAARVSPLDQGNLNREFPGRVDGTPTQMIAYYISHELAPRLDYSLDIHSGGASLNYIPTVLTVRPEDAQERAQVKRLTQALGLPLTTVFRGAGGVSGGRTLASVIRAHGGLPLAAEIGGGARLTPETVALARDALRRYLRAVGVWHGPAAPEPRPTRCVSVAAEDYLYALEPGIFEPAVHLGDSVSAGTLAGRVLYPDTPWRSPWEVRFDRPGLVMCERPMSLCARGDCVFQICQPWPDALD